MAMAVVLMGVSGCGKTYVGRELSRVLGWPFIEGDDYHPPGNIAKMSRGIPLRDADRHPWLETLRDAIVDHLEEDRSLILACSSLKASYRDILREGASPIQFVHLVGDFALIQSRIQGRKGHFLKDGMLKSQYLDLEIPQNALTIEVDQSPSQIIDQIVSQLGLTPARGTDRD